MAGLIRIGTLVFLACLVGACGLKVPNSATFAANCAAVEPPRNVEASRFYFWSTRIPDCRKGLVSFTGFRDEGHFYGRSVADGPPTRPGQSSRSIHTPDPDAWLEGIKERVRQDPGGRLLIYVHGFNNDYNDEFARAHALAELVPGNSPVIIYDWPSRNKVSRYSVDANSAVWAQDDFNAMLVKLSGISKNITIVSHSMGNRIAIGGVRYLRLAAPAAAPNVKRMVLASPDFDRATAQRSALPDLATDGRAIVIYASRHDRPIGVSTGIHGYALLGSSRCRYDINHDRSQRQPGDNCHLVPALPNLAVVDTSDVAARGVLNHTDFVSSCAVRTDLRAFLEGHDKMPWREGQAFEGRVGYKIDREYFRSQGQLGDCPEIK